jgi:uncharacterized membrane protein
MGSILFMLCAFFEKMISYVGFKCNFFLKSILNVKFISFTKTFLLVIVSGLLVEWNSINMLVEKYTNKWYIFYEKGSLSIAF